MTSSRFPPGWDEDRVRRVLEHYGSQTEDEAAAEDESAYEEPGYTIVQVPPDLLPAIRRLIAERKVS